MTNKLAELITALGGHGIATPKTPLPQRLRHTPSARQSKGKILSKPAQKRKN
jgi:hypothetical protein